MNISKKERVFKLTQSAQLKVSVNHDPEEWLTIISRKRRYQVWQPNDPSPHLSLVKDGVHPNEFALAVVASKLVQESSHDYLFAESLRRFAWRLSHAGFKQSSRRLAELVKEPLNGYRLNAGLGDKQTLLLVGSRRKPRLIVAHERPNEPWNFELVFGLSDESQEELIKLVGLVSVHDLRLRKLVGGQKFINYHRRVAEKRRRHQTGSRSLRQWNSREGGGSDFFSVNEHEKKTSFAYHLILTVPARGNMTVRGRRSYKNRLLIEAIDSLSDSFTGRYRVQYEEAWFSKISDLSAVIERIKRCSPGDLSGSEVYLRMTETFFD